MHMIVYTVCGNMLSSANQVLITAIVCSLAFFVLGMLFGALFHYWATVRCVCKFKQPSSNSPTPPAALTQVVYEEVSPDSERKCDIELKGDNLAYVPVVAVHWYTRYMYIHHIVHNYVMLFILKLT